MSSVPMYRAMNAAHGSGGFALLEALVALAIIGLVAVGLLGATAAQVRTADKAALLVNARALGEERMMTLRTLTYDELTDVPDSLVGGVFPPPFGEYSWHADIAPVPDEHDLFSAVVRVTVHDEVFVLNTLLHSPRPFFLAEPGG